MRASNSSTSSSSKALPRLSIGTRCWTGANWAEGAAPTRSEGEFGRTRCGKRASMAALRRFRRVVFGVGDVGASSR